MLMARAMAGGRLPRREPRNARRQRGFLALTGLIGFGGYFAPKSLTFTDHATDTANLTTYTFSARAIGTAASDRRVHVLVHGGGVGDTTLSSVTVGGVSATINVQASSGQHTSAIATAAVPTGTTGDVVVTFSGGKARCGIGVYASTGLSSETAVDTDSSTADPATATLTSVAGGFVLALAAGDNSSSLTWTNVTEDYDEVFESTVQSGASGVTSSTTVSPSGDYASAPTNKPAVFATF
jgi:hypothetical protein